MNVSVDSKFNDLPIEKFPCLLSIWIHSNSVYPEPYLNNIQKLVVCGARFFLFSGKLRHLWEEEVDYIVSETTDNLVLTSSSGSDIDELIEEFISIRDVREEKITNWSVVILGDDSIDFEYIREKISLSTP